MAVTTIPKTPSKVIRQKAIIKTNTMTNKENSLKSLLEISPYIKRQVAGNTIKRYHIRGVILSLHVTVNG